MEDQSVVDPVIVQFRSPAKMARSAIGQDQIWVTPDKRARQKLRDTFDGSDRLKRFKIDEELPAKELKFLVEKGVRASVVAFAAGGEEHVIKGMEFAAESNSCNAHTLCASLDETFRLAGISEEGEEIEDDHEDRLRVVKAAAVRAMDLSLIEKKKSTGCAKSWASATVLAANAKKEFIAEDVIGALEARDQRVFEDEKDGSVQSRRLLIMRLQRAMAERMTTAPRRELIKQLVAEKREGMTGEGVGEVSTPDQFHSLVSEFEQLGEVELQLRAKEAAEVQQAETRKASGGFMTSGGDTSETGEPRAKRFKSGGGMTGGETSDSEVEQQASSRPPAREDWSTWSAAQVFDFFAKSSGLGGELTVTDREGWGVTGAALVSCSSGRNVAENCTLSESQKVRVQQVFDPFFRRITFGKQTGASDGSVGQLKKPGRNSDPVFGVTKGNQFSGKQVAQNPVLRRFWLGALVMWLDEGRERIGQIASAENGSHVTFRIEPADAMASDVHWSIEQAVQGMKSYNELVDRRQDEGQGVDLFSLVRETSSGGSGLEGPRKRIKKETRKVEEVLVEAAQQLAEGNKFPLSFSAKGLESGEDLRLLLLAVNGGGAGARTVADSEVGQQIIVTARENLAKHGSVPSNLEIIYAAFASRQFTGLECFNVGKDGAESIPEAKTRIEIVDGKMEVIEVHKDSRAKRFISTQEQNNFALLRWKSCLVAAHGEELATKWYMNMVRMQDDITVMEVPSNVIRPMRDIWAATWAEIPGKLSAAARRMEKMQADETVKRKGAVETYKGRCGYLGEVMLHAGATAGEVSMVLKNWHTKMDEICMMARLRWMNTLCGSVGKRELKTGRLALDEMPRGPKGTKSKKKKGTGEMPTGKIFDVLKDNNFENLAAAKKDFVDGRGNKGKCFWACSRVGKQLGGCDFDTCKFTHPGAPPT